MKSIKEKAEEHLRENNITQYEYKSYIEGAGFGVKYVLNEIEKLVNFKRWSAQDLYELIKQLKSNQ